MENTSTTKKILNLNLPQMMVQMIQANETWCLWGRGTGKTIGAIAPRMIQLAEAMPGHLSCIVGKDFEHLDKNIMPKLIQGIEMNGYYRDKHFVVGTKPPKNWPNCLYPLKKWDRTIAWQNGTVFHQISLHQSGSANAFDFQSGIFDEVKFMDQNQLEDEVFPTFRGFENIFGHRPEYLAKIFATDKYEDYLKLKWILDKRKSVDQAKINTVLQLQLHLNDLQAKMHIPAAQEIKREMDVQIRKIKGRLLMLRKDLIYVSEASAMDNIDNLGPKWLSDKKRTMGDYEFKVAIQNEDPMTAEDSFYPGLTDDILYQEDYGNDYRSDKPLTIAMDYQHSVTPMVVTQTHQLPWESRLSINFINEFYTVHPQGLEECIDLFCHHYRTHINKVVYYVYDQTATGERQSSHPVKDIVVKHFRKNGWAIVECYTGATPMHHVKFELIKTWMAAPEEQTTMIRFNKSTCIKTMTSMLGSGTVIYKGRTQKDKKYELTSRYPSIDQTETTHFSDCVDQVLWYYFGKKMGQRSGEKSSLMFR